MPLITEDEIESVDDTFTELRVQAEAAEMAAREEEMETDTEEVAIRNEPNDYGVPYLSPRSFWVGPSSDDESMPDYDQENQPPRMRNDRYEELRAWGILNLAHKLGLVDVEGLVRLAQSPQVFHAVSALVRKGFLHREANYLDWAPWHLARRIYLVGSRNAAEVGVNTDGDLKPLEWMALSLVDLFEAMEVHRREMGIETWGCKSLKWRVYYGILMLYLDNDEMRFALLLDQNQDRNWNADGVERLQAFTAAAKAFAEVLCEEGEYDSTAAVSYSRGLGPYTETAPYIRDWQGDMGY